MRANGIEMSATAASANSATPTLAAVSNKPTFADVYGTTGSRTVSYTLTDGGGREEHGVGDLNLSTSVLTRMRVLSTYDSGATPKYTSSGATRLTTFSGTVSAVCSPIANDMVVASPFTTALGGSLSGLGNGMCNNNMSNGVLTTNLQGWRSFSLFQWSGASPITSCRIRVSTAGAAGEKLRVALMELTGPNTCRLLREFTSTTQFAVDSTGWKALVAPTDFEALPLSPGMYVLQIVYWGGGALRLQAYDVHHNAGTAIFGWNSSGNLPFEGWLESAGATTCATTSTYSGIAHRYGNSPVVIFGMG